MSDNADASNPYAAPEGDLTTENENQAGVLASLWSRLGAAILDGIIMGVVTVIPLMAIMGGWSGYVNKVAAGGFILKVGLGVFGWVAYMVVNGYFLAQSGQSLGKKAVGIKIVRTDGSQPPLQHIVLRRLAPMYVAQVVPFIGPWLGLADVLLIFRSSRQCVHDQIADTIVVNA